MNQILDDKVKNEFSQKPVFKLIMKYTTPAIVSMLFMAVYQIIDGMMVGQKVGMESLAAVNVLYPLLALLSAIGVTIGVGGNTKIAVFLGENKIKEACKTFGLIFYLGILVGLIGTVTVYLFLPSILNLLGEDTLLGYHAGEYLKGITPFFIPMLLLFILEQAIRNDGKPGLSGLTMVISAVMNVVLTYLFLYVFNMETFGAGLATGLSQSIGALMMISYFINKAIRKKSGLNFSRFSFQKNLIKSIMANGSSEGLNSLSLGITTLAFNTLIIIHIGTIGVAAYSIVTYILMIGQVIILGFAVGIQPILSFNHGAGNQQRVHSTLKTTMILSISMMILLFVFLSFSGEKFIILFSKDHVEAIHLAKKATNLLKWSILIMPFNIIITTYFTSIEKARQSFLISLLRGLIIPIICLYLLSTSLGQIGIWMTPVVVEIITFWFCFVMYKREGSKMGSIYINNHLIASESKVS